MSDAFEGFMGGDDLEAEVDFLKRELGRTARKMRAMTGAQARWRGTSDD